jgi:DNA polymerase III subunit gamma/tau
MTYVVLARKWRPMSFADLVGQGHVATTLANAIANNRVAHAFLFTGVRGVGKTTSARILAKALNCLHAPGPTATPCLECAACKEIALGTDVDVQEIDGASYNGVDEVRRLQESLPYRPSRDRYKIVIVDEVHMLTQSAWNAFLKTLEEPPAHVKFIFATTEVHKVPVTILSRVQRFDFKLIPAKLIVERLRYMLQQENIPAEDQALGMLARQAAGSMRDATSLLDQVIAWSDRNVTAAGVSQALGVASRQVMYDLATAVLKADAAKALHIVDSVARQGFEMTHVAKDFLALLRDIVVAATCKDPSDLLDLPEEEQRDVQQLATHPLDDLLRLHQGFSQGFDEVARTAQPRAALEMLLVRLSRRPPLVPVDDLLDRLVQLEKRIRQAGARPTSAPLQAPSAPVARPMVPSGKREARTESTTGGGAKRDTPTDDPEPAAPTSAPNVAARRGTNTEQGSHPNAPQDVANAAPSEGPRERRVPSTPPLSAANAAPRQGPRESRVPSTPPLPAAKAAPREGTRESSVPSTPLHAARQTFEATVETATVEVTREDFELLPTWERWRRIIDPLRRVDAGLGAFLDHAFAFEITRETVRIGFERDSVFRSTIIDPQNRIKIQEAAYRVLEARPQFEWIENAASEPGNTRTVFDVDKQARLKRHRDALERARAHPMVTEAVRVLGARVKNIAVPET